MPLIDTHCHLDILGKNQEFMKKFGADFRESFTQYDIKTLMQIGTDYQSSLFSQAIAGYSHNKRNSAYSGLDLVYKRVFDEYSSWGLEKLCRIYYSLGLHPSEAEQDDGEAETGRIADLARQSKEDPLFRAIGESGLDYYWNKQEANHKKQREIFSQMLCLSRELNRPVILHCRDAYDDLYHILRKEHNGHGIVHCFTGTPAQAKDLCDMGYYISFSGIVTFKNAAGIQKAAVELPEDKILTETDSPYLAPVPRRGETNIPAYVFHTAVFLASLRKTPEQRMLEILEANAKRAFGI